MKRHEDDRLMVIVVGEDVNVAIAEPVAVHAPTLTTTEMV